MTLFEMKEKIFSLENERKSIADYINEKAADPNASIEEIEAKQKKMDELTKRIDILQKAHDVEEKRQRAALAAQNGGGTGTGMTEKEAKIKVKADFYRDAINGMANKAYEGLGAIPTATADLGSGDKLLPTNLARELLVEPFEVNPLRNVARITNITGLEEPKLGYTIEDADLADVTDQQTANEIALSGDTVAYGRMKAKVSATIKDTVLHGTDLDIVTRVEQALRSALAKREKHFAFLPAASCASDATHKHMSFYNGTISEGVTTYEIVAKTGATLYEAIIDALGDLADDFSANARVMMKKADYYGMVKELANDSEALFGSKPASILGFPVEFCDKATIPLVGDFQYYGINYDIGTIYETDKDAKKGEYYFVLTAWGDQQIRLKSAFRLAIVNP